MYDRIIQLVKYTRKLHQDFKNIEGTWAKFLARQLVHSQLVSSLSAPENELLRGILSLART